MIYDLQKAMIWKRISAWLFDAIILGIVVVGISYCLSSLLGYDSYSALLDERYEAYEQEYKVNLGITEKEFNELLPEKQQAFLDATQALSEDAQARKAYSMMINLSMVISSLGMLGGFLILEFAVPLWLKNGQTLGKKIFSIGVMRVDGVKVTTFQMFVRTVLGKFTLETMLPVLVGTLIFFGSLGFGGTLLILGLGAVQVILLCVTSTNSLIHDLLANTVVIDMPSQMIFETQEAMLDYKKKVQAEMADREYD